jgi:hypothetical protein
VNPKESHADGEQDDAREHAEEEEEEDPLGRLHLEQDQEVRVERGGLAPRHLILRIGDHRTGRKARARAQQRRIVLKKCR